MAAGFQTQRPQLPPGFMPAGWPGGGRWVHPAGWPGSSAAKHITSSKNLPVSTDHLVVKTPQISSTQKKSLIEGLAPTSQALPPPASQTNTNQSNQPCKKVTRNTSLHALKLNYTRCKMTRTSCLTLMFFLLALIDHDWKNLLSHAFEEVHLHCNSTDSA